MRRALLIATMALAVTSPPVAAETPYMEFLTHVSAAAGEGGDLFTAADGEGAIEWAEDERDWLLENLPDVCYVDVWGRWLSIVTMSLAAGWSLDAGETLTATFSGTWVATEAAALSPALEAATFGCMA